MRTCDVAPRPPYDGLLGERRGTVRNVERRDSASGAAVSVGCPPIIAVSVGFLRSSGRLMTTASDPPPSTQLPSASSSAPVMRAICSLLASTVVTLE